MSTFRADPNNPLPLYYQVYNSIRERIESGEFSPGSALPPERQLGTEYDVSRITIVKALDRLVTEGLIEKQQGRGTFVLEQNQAESEQKFALGYIPAGLLHPYFYSIQMGMAEVTTRENCELHVIGLHETQREDLDTIVENARSSVNGLVVYPRPNKKDIALYRRLLAEGIPFVMIDRYYDEIDSDSVVFDGWQASYDLTQLLIDRGHRRIAIISHFEVNVSSIRQRVGGYKQCLVDNQLVVDESLIWLDVYANLRPAVGQKGDENMTNHLEELIDLHQPTALIAVNQDVSHRLTYDIMMINHKRAQTVIQSNGNSDYELKVEVVGFSYNNPEDDGPYHIATALQPGDILGHHATQMMLQRLRGVIKGDPQRMKVPIEIAVRENLADRSEEVKND